MKAILQQLHHVSHRGSLLSRSGCALKRGVSDFPHTIDIVVAMHARIHHTFNVATG
jgi:hypothetical protein